MPIILERKDRRLNKTTHIHTRTHTHTQTNFFSRHNGPHHGRYACLAYILFLSLEFFDFRYEPNQKQRKAETKRKR